MLIHSMDIQTDRDGLPVVRVALELSAGQIGACAHAVRVAREERFRVPQLSVDEILTMREMTSLADQLGELAHLAGHARVELTVARLAALREAIETFCESRGSDIVREGDGDALPLARLLSFDLDEIQAEAVRAALDSVPCEH